MADVIDALTRIIAGNITIRVAEVISSIDGISACAGIKGSEGGTEIGHYGVNIAKEAMYNHYGRTNTYANGNAVFVPARPYITDTENGAMTQESIDNLREYVRQAIKATPSERRQRWASYEWGGKLHTSAYDSKGKSLGAVKAFGTTNSPRFIMRDLSKKMLENQIRNMGNVERNAESTLKKKKMRSTEPLIDYGALLKTTKRWIEMPNGDTELVGD